MRGTWLFAASLMLLISGLDAQGSCYWTAYPRSLIYGGMPFSSASNLGACQAACVASSGCTGVDWAQGNAAGNQCFLLQKKTDRVSNVDGVDHYDYDCPNQGGCNFSPPYQNTLIYGGSANPATSEEACKNACRMNSSCQGIDWAPGNAAGQQCFLQSKTTDKIMNAPGVTHYDYNCTGTTGTTLIPQRECKTAADLAADTSSIGGYSVPEVSPIYCYVTCLLLGPCLGYDVGPTGCWFHFNVTSFPQKYYQQGIAQITFTRCPEDGISSCTPAYSNGVLTDACISVCYPKWTRWEDTAGSGGQVVTTAGFRNASACLEYCFRRSDCLGVDYSDQPGSPSVCTFYNQFYSMNNTVNRPFVAQYRLDSRCSRNCKTYWQNSDNLRYRLYNPVVLMDVSTQQECERRCRISDTCAIYQCIKSGPGSPRCTVADKFYEFSGVNDSNVFTGIYRENCNMSSLPPTPPMPGGCNFSPAMPNTLIYGGSANPASSEEACKNACRMSSSCQGIDWAPGNTAGQQCFLQSKTTDKNTNAPGVTHYDYYCNGSGSTTLPGTVYASTTMPTTNCWDIYPNTLIYGGTQNPATTLNDCQNACRTAGRQACLSVDWSRTNAVGTQCFLLNTQMGKVQGAMNVDHYDLRSTC